MPSHKLFLGDLYDDKYKLIAIHCNLEDYRLAYVLNQKLGLNLKRHEEDLDLSYLKSSYSIFEYANNAQDVKWHLVSNICKKEEDAILSTGTLFQNNEKTLKTFNLIPEYKTVDFFIKISDGIEAINNKVLQYKLQQIPQIVTSYAVDPLQLKSRDHLIF